MSSFGLLALMGLCFAAWLARGHWLTERFTPPPIERPVVGSNQVVATKNPRAVLEKAAVLAADTLDKEPCDRRALQEFVGASVALNHTRELLQRTATFEKSCGEWDVLSMVQAEGHAQLSEWAKAEPHYDRWVELAAKNASAWSARGRFRQARGNVAGAIADYERAILLEPAYTDVPQWLASLLIDAERFCDAIPVLERLLMTAPKLFESQKLTGMLSKARTHPGCESSLGQGRAQLQLLGDDQMLDIDARIGGRPYAAVLDTGASYVTLPASVAISLGIDLGRAPKVDVTVIGAIRPAHRVVLEKISIGDAVATNVAAIVVDEVFPGTDTILLGMSFLSRFKLVFDPLSNTILLEAPAADSAEAPAAGERNR
jgi:aspartyl protease family protein